MWRQIMKTMKKYLPAICIICITFFMGCSVGVTPAQLPGYTAQPAPNAVGTDQTLNQPDSWDIADNALELGIAVAGLFGGVYGIKVAGFLKQARSKSNALREIIAGNELLKKQDDKLNIAFKTAHQNQSPQTRKIVAEIKQS